MKALVDGDILVYSVGFSVEHVYYDVYYKDEQEPFLKFDYAAQFWDWVPWCDYIEDIRLDKRREVQPLSHCLHSLKECLESLKAEVGADELIIFLTGEGNFRDSVATILPYKGNRDKAHKPTYYNQIKTFLINRYDAIVVDGQEADDALGIYQTKFNKEGIPSVICSRDKDLLQIPGNHYNVTTRAKTTVTEEGGIRFFFKQLLTGDSTDNIVGCPGIGQAKAEKLLKEAETPKEMFKVCLREYKKKYNYDGAIIENGRLLWIRRHEGEDWADEAFKLQE